MTLGRPRKVDPEDALDAAMEVFWARGYEATSMTDLVAATGLHKGSLYQTFGDKHALFCLALERYLDRLFALKRDFVVGAESATDGLRRALREMMAMAHAEDGTLRGCLGINTLVERAGSDDTAKQILCRHFERSMAFLTQTIDTAQANGEIDSRQPAEQIALLLMTFMAGLASVGKGAVDEDHAYGLLDAQLEVLGFKKR